MTLMRAAARSLESNGDGGLDLSDAISTLGLLFLGNPVRFPCGDGSPRDPANISLMDWQPDGTVDLSDAIASLTFLFTGGPRHALAIPGSETEGCVLIVGCVGSAHCP